MMKFTIFLLSAVLIPAQLILAGQGYIDEAKVKKMINDAGIWFWGCLEALCDVRNPGPIAFSTSHF